MKKIDVLEHSAQILKSLGKGVLLTTKSGDRVNTMTIAWGMLGIEWHRNIFTALIREGRHTREMLDSSGEFTVNIPLEYNESTRKILAFTGANSLRNVDKVKELGLTLVDGVDIQTPAIKEFALTLECKVFYKQIQRVAELPEEVYKKCYPQDVDSTNPRANRDAHIAYYGEIVNAYIID